MSGAIQSLLDALEELRKPLTPHGKDAKKKEPKAKETTEPPKKTPTQIVISVVSTIIVAVAGAITLTGFVSLVGGAVFWTRFEAVGIPYDQAVAVVDPKQSIVIGASTILVFLITAIFAVLFLYALDSSGWVSQATLLGLGLLVVAGAVYVVSVQELGVKDWCGLVIGAILLAGICLAVADQTERRFIPFGAAVFVAVLVWGGVLGFLNAQALKQVQAAAVFGGKDVRAARGFYVTATDDKIYLARPFPKRVAHQGDSHFDDKGLFEIERTDATRLAIGPLEDEDVARPESKVLLHKLKAQSAKQGRLDAKARAAQSKAKNAASGK